MKGYNLAAVLENSTRTEVSAAPRLRQWYAGRAGLALAKMTGMTPSN